MKKIIAALFLSCAVMTTVHANNCINVAKSMNPYQGLVGKITNVELIWENYPYHSDEHGAVTKGWKYAGNYQFPGHQSFPFEKSAGKEKTPSFTLKNDDTFFFKEETNFEMKTFYHNIGTRGYMPVVLAGKKCLLIQLGSSITQFNLMW